MLSMDKDGTVRQDKRTIGFIKYFTIRSEGAWRFIANRKDVAERYSVPAPKFATTETAFEHVKQVLG